jgi:hypothetical protein
MRKLLLSLALLTSCSAPYVVKAPKITRCTGLNSGNLFCENQGIEGFVHPAKYQCLSPSDDQKIFEHIILIQDALSYCQTWGKERCKEKVKSILKSQ